jgi:hypothetical protein
MKLLLAVYAALAAVPTFAQNHMFEFNAEALVAGDVAVSRTKERGERAAAEPRGQLQLSFARAVTPRVQVGAKAATARPKPRPGSETGRVLLGGIYNFTGLHRHRLRLRLSGPRPGTRFRLQRS